MRFVTILLLGTIMSVQSHAAALKAIVNDTPIFESQVEARADLLKAQQPEVYQGKSVKELKQEALQNLIDETLKIQKIQDLGIKISDKDITQAINHLEQQNGFSKGGLQRLLEEQKVPMNTLRQQVRADLGWLSYVRSQIQKVSIPKTAVAERLQKIRLEMSQPTYTIAEIQVKTLEQAQNLWQQLQDGANFAELAKKYSQAKSSSFGGYIGSIDDKHYGTEISKILKEMPVGQLSRPIPRAKDYLILYMIDKKAPVTDDSITLWELAQGNIDPKTDTTALLSAKNCDDFIQAIRQAGQEDSIQRGWTDPYQLPTDLKNALDAMAIREVLGPVRVPSGQVYFMKCDIKSQRVVPTDAEVQEQLEMEQMEVQAKRLLNAEKRRAIIEYK